MDIPTPSPLKENKLGDENDPNIPEATAEPSPPQPEGVFCPGEQSVTITLNDVTVQTHFTNSSPIETSNLTFELLQQTRNISTKQKQKPSYT